jgi:hypothetical protein
VGRRFYAVGFKALLRRASSTESAGEGFDEVIELTHRAYSRGIFAAGCVRAARFLAGRPAGRYGMDDMVDPCC